MDEHRLDGNAAGGILGEIFPFEMTSAQAACASCHAVWLIGQAMVYAHEMGTVVRCATCDKPLIRIARGEGRYWLDLRGVEYLQMVAEP
jgi:Zn finger protein HypA/HybF involved in hydrogenase expression